MEEQDSLHLIGSPDSDPNSYLLYLSFEGCEFDENRPHSAKTTQGRLFEKFQELMLRKKVYLDSNITLTSMAELLEISPGYLSQWINTNFGLHFNDFINSHRIAQAERMLLDPSYDNYTIHGIALESGFNTKSSFYRAFKKLTGLTPTEFIKSKQKKS